MPFIINPYRYTGGGGLPYTPPLDLVGSAACAFGVRKLLTAYAGSCLRIRRSSDNAEQDIGFDGNGLIDTAAIDSFVGANSGFVKTWYDQSGNARDFTQTTAGSQPRIINSGTIDTKNSIPTVVFDGSDDQLDGNAASLSLHNACVGFTSLLVIAPNAATSNRIIFFLSANASASAARYVHGVANSNRFRSTQRRVDGDTGGAATSAADAAYVSGTLVHSALKVTYPTSQLATNYLSGTSHFTHSASFTSGATSDANDCLATTIGAAGAVGSTEYSGTISELIAYRSDLNDTDRLSVSQNQGTYYSVTMV